MATFESRELVEALIAEFGGVAGLAHAVVEEIRPLPVGHQNRIKVMMGILSAAMKFGSPEPDEEDLEEKKRVLKRLVKEMQDEEDEPDDWNDAES